MGGGGKTTSETVPQPIQIPEFLLPLLTQSANQIAGFQNQYPLTSLMQPMPQQITPLSPLELKLLGQQVSTSQAPAYTFPELAALSQINQLTGGPVGSSPATLAGMNAWERLTKPQVEQSAALAGLSRGGALPESMAMSSSEAAVPLIQQEIQNRMGALLPLSGLGSAVAERERGDTATALGAAGLPRQVADLQNQANFLDQMRRAGIVQMANLGIPSQLFPAVIPGAGSTSSSTQKPTGIWTSLGRK